jgi:hypothetical protein
MKVFSTITFLRFYLETWCLLFPLEIWTHGILRLIYNGNTRTLMVPLSAKIWITPQSFGTASLKGQFSGFRALKSNRAQEGMISRHIRQFKCNSIHWTCSVVWTRLNPHSSLSTYQKSLEKAYITDYAALSSISNKTTKKEEPSNFHIGLEISHTNSNNTLT